jgi:hypothetical protein
MSQVGYGSQDSVAVPFDLYVPLTGFSITPQTNMLVLNPAGTLATGTVLLPLNAPDGASLTIVSTQTQTALTVTANTGDLIVGTAITALVALTPVRLSYSLNGSIPKGLNPRTWFRTQ